MHTFNTFLQFNELPNHFEIRNISELESSAHQDLIKFYSGIYDISDQDCSKIMRWLAYSLDPRHG